MRIHPSPAQTTKFNKICSNLPKSIQIHANLLIQIPPNPLNFAHIHNHANPTKTIKSYAKKTIYPNAHESVQILVKQSRANPIVW